jgi:ABC-type amino acid transport substrate-binding protein
MQLLRYPGPATVYTASPPLVSRADAQPSALQRIRTRGVIRVGHRNDFLPFSYTNAASNLVGLGANVLHWVE